MTAEERKPLLEDDKGINNGSVTGIFGGKKPRKSVVQYLTNENVSFWERRRRKKGVAKYLEAQSHLLSLYEEDDRLFEDFSHLAVAESNNAVSNRKRKVDSILASVSFSLNIVLVFANATASFLSGSLSVISTFIDSAMDSTSGILIYISMWAIKNTNSFNYPRGRTRLELVAVLACSIIMGVANVMMIIQSVESIINETVDPDANFATIAILVGGCTAKIILMAVCYRQGTPSCKTMALDQRNDILTSVVALAGAYIGDHYWLYADPIGAICVCTFIACSWFYNALDNIPMMVGKRAQQEHLARVIRICIEHDAHIKCLDHAMVYHTGAEAIVEAHVVLDENLPLKITHDVIESLTNKISALPFVERAFVHCDYRCDGDWNV